MQEADLSRWHIGQEQSRQESRVVKKAVVKVAESSRRQSRQGGRVVKEAESSKRQLSRWQSRPRSKLSKKDN